MDKRKKMMGIGIIGIAAVAAIVIAGGVYVNSSAHRVKKCLDLGRRYLLELDYENAAAYFQAAIEIEPSNPKVQEAVAECVKQIIKEAERYESLPDYASEEKMALCILNLDENSVEGKRLAANAAYWSGRPEEALRYYEAVLAEDASDQEANAGKALCETAMLLADAKNAYDGKNFQEAL